MAAHDEIGCLTAGMGLIARILDEADALAYPPVEIVPFPSPRDELLHRLPLMLAHLSPEARLLIRDHQGHCIDLVAALHMALALG